MYKGHHDAQITTSMNTTLPMIPGQNFAGGMILRHSRASDILPVASPMILVGPKAHLQTADTQLDSPILAQQQHTYLNNKRPMTYKPNETRRLLLPACPPSLLPKACATAGSVGGNDTYSSPPLLVRLPNSLNALCLNDSRASAKSGSLRSITRCSMSSSLRTPSGQSFARS